MFFLEYLSTIPCDFSPSQSVVSCAVCNFFLVSASLVLPIFLHTFEGIYFQGREWHSNWITGNKPRQYSIRIVASEVVTRTNLCQQFSSIRGGGGAGDGISHLELSIVLCSVSVFQNSSCCQTELSGCVPTLFLESGNRFISVLNMK